MTVMAPGDAREIGAMLDFSLQHDGPCSLRYPKTGAVTVDRDAPPIEHGRAEVYEEGPDGVLIGCGVMFPVAVAAAEKLRSEGLDVTVVNPRFVKPVDIETLRPAAGRRPVGDYRGGERRDRGVRLPPCWRRPNARGVRTDHVRVLALPDEFIEHGPREELLADYGLDADGLKSTALSLADRGVAVV